MASQYKQKKALLAREIEQRGCDHAEQLHQLCLRLCEAPFSRKPGSATFWIECWPHLSAQGKDRVVEMPTPCLNHLESRDRKEERSAHLRAGLLRLLGHDEELFLDGLRLFPHELCRASETVGPLKNSQWTEILETLAEHRLWQTPEVTSESDFWSVAEQLRVFRDLPQPVLDHLDQERPLEDAPVQDFMDSLPSFLLRKKIEKIRSATYKELREHDLQNRIEPSLEG